MRLSRSAKNLHGSMGVQEMRDSSRRWRLFIVSEVPVTPQVSGRASVNFADSAGDKCNYRCSNCGEGVSSYFNSPCPSCGCTVLVKNTAVGTKYELK